ncbi:MAG: hypothetical protein H7333_08285 [Bdellovibrionales bacterium]|nr:hypothetical protein [Oligoflexia bacterium]
MKTYQLLSIALAFSQGLYSQATPILSQNEAQNVDGLLTLYPESSDQNLFYFFPNSATFQTSVIEGKATPLFGFTYWGLSNGGALADAGAFLTFTAHLASDEQQRKVLDAFIAAGRKVAVLPLMSSTISLHGTKSGEAPLSRLFDEFNFSQQGGMAEDDIGVNALMTGLGAKTFRSAIQNNSLMKVDYCFKFQGLGPNFKADINMDYQKVYDAFQAHFSGGGWFTKASINAEVEKLRESEIIHIKTDGGTAVEKDYVSKIADKIAARLFVAELDTKSVGTADIGGWSFTKFTFNNTHREQLGFAKWSIEARDLVEREFCIPVNLSGLKPFYGEVVKNADDFHL